MTNDLAEQFYLGFESEALKCTGGIPLFEKADLKETSDILQSELSYTGYKKLRVSLRKKETLSELIQDLSDQLSEFRDKRTRFQAKLQSRELGYYTEEQQADDIEAEYASRLGLTAEEILNSEVNFGKAVGAWSVQHSSSNIEPSDDPSTSACISQLKTHWEGEPFPVMGRRRLSSHHDTCFRLFNLDQELRAHAYKPGPRVLPPASPTFEELKALAEQIK